LSEILIELVSFRMKASGEQFDERIVEVHWDPQHEHWRLMRFRDDKPAGNGPAACGTIQLYSQCMESSA